MSENHEENTDMRCCGACCQFCNGRCSVGFEDVTADDGFAEVCRFYRNSDR